MTKPDIRYVTVGYSRGLLTAIDGRVPPASVLVIEEPEVIKSRSVRAAVRRFTSVADLVAAPTQDEDEPEQLAAAVPRPASLRAVLPGVEYTVVAAAALAKAWQVPGAGLTAARTFRDKTRLRQLADKADVPQPQWQVLTSGDDIPALRARFGGHCVLKPANLQASLGVQVLGPDDDAIAAWRQTTSVDDLVLRVQRPRTPRYLLEQRLLGPEISVEVLVSHGVIAFKNITAKSVQKGRYPVEVGHLVPAPLEDVVIDRLARHVTRLVAAAGFGSGVLHSEWILVNDKHPHLVECAARLPGDGITELIDLAYGPSLAVDYLQVLSGYPIHRVARPHRAAAVRFLRARPGLVTEVRGRSEAEQAPGVHEVSIAPAVDDVIEPVTSSWQRAGHVVAVGAAPHAAAARARHAAAMIDVITQTVQ